MLRFPGFDRVTALFVGLILTSFVLVTLDLRASGAGIGGTLRDGTQAAFAPIQRVVGSVTRPVVNFFETISDLGSLRDENERLRGEIADLERELQETEALQRRVEELEEVLGVEPPEEIESVTARVLAVGVSEFDFTRVIDKGREDGITVDMPVVDEGGLIGRVVAVTDSTARVLLVTDPTVRVAVRVERTGETGVVTGRGSGPLGLEMFNTDAVLLEGDLLVTADGRFPAGITVARVDQAARSEVGFALRTTAVPTAEITRVDFVKVLIFTRDEGGATGGGEETEEPEVEVPTEDVEPSEGEPEEGPDTSTTTVAEDES
jgi:rod shape-determining protein MreC